jgi:hypothetical protein
MKKLIIPLAASLALFSAGAMAASPSASNRAKSTEGNPTSTRSPGNPATTPNSQVDTTKNGMTSDRTPSNHGSNGAASGEEGMGTSAVSSSQQQAYDETYKTDKAQEQQLKSGGGSK